MLRSHSDKEPPVREIDDCRCQHRPEPADHDENGAQRPAGEMGEQPERPRERVGQREEPDHGVAAEPSLGLACRSRVHGSRSPPDAFVDRVSCVDFIEASEVLDYRVLMLGRPEDLGGFLLRRSWVRHLSISPSASDRHAFLRRRLLTLGEGAAIRPRHYRDDQPERCPPDEHWNHKRAA